MLKHLVVTFHEENQTRLKRKCQNQQLKINFEINDIFFLNTRNEAYILLGIKQLVKVKITRPLTNTLKVFYITSVQVKCSDNFNVSCLVVVKES